jgi:cytochrome c peroxidase
MHDGSITTWEELIFAVGNNDGNPDNFNLDPIIPPGGSLNITEQEGKDLIAFLKTLSGNDVYTNEIWSNPF